MDSETQTTLLEMNNGSNAVNQINLDDHLLEAIDLTKSYKVNRRVINAINGISVNVCRGEFIALTGASGSGKSTLLHLLGGLDKPSSGAIEINGKNINKMGDRALSKFRNQTIGFVFQSFYLQPFLTLRRNIEVAAMPRRTRRAERIARTDELARRVGLYDRLNHRPRELSGGQIQRAAIARALLNQPQIILADEPTGNLDSQNSQEIINLFKQIRNDYGTAIVIATHDHEIASQADRIITLKDGALA